MAEYQKLKRTFTKKIVWIAPIITMLLCAVLGAGNSFQNGSYNWWYVMILPGALTMICAGVIQKDMKKLNYRSILGLPVDLSQLWIGKIGVCLWLFFISCLIFFIGVTFGGFVFKSSISFAHSTEGSLILFVTFLWQIPLCLFLTDRLGMFATIFINLAGNMLGTIFAAKASLWWAFTYAIPARVMCPVIKVLPNGLPVPTNDPLVGRSVILPGVMISIVLFIILSAFTSLWSRNLEVK